MGPEQFQKEIRIVLVERTKSLGDDPYSTLGVSTECDTRDARAIRDVVQRVDGFGGGRECSGGWSAR